MNNARGVARLANLCVRQIHSTPKVSSAGKPSVPYSELCPKLKANMELFQKDNNLPVHLKGGPMDQILYRLTMALTLGATASSMYFLVQQSYK